MGKPGDREHQKFDISDLQGFSECLYAELIEYTERSLAGPDDEPKIDLALLSRLLDFKIEPVSEIWRTIDLIGRSKVSDSKKKELAALIRHIDHYKFQWSLSDQDSHEEQKANVKNIGKLAQSLFAKIISADDGYVSDFLSWWHRSESSKQLPYDVFLIKSQLRAFFTSAYQETLLNQERNPEAELLIRLASLSAAAAKYEPSEIPRSLLGLKSQKKNKLSFFIIRIYTYLEELFDKSMYAFCANLASVAFEQPIDKTRVKEIIERARERGEIPPKKNKKTPLT